MKIRTSDIYRVQSAKYNFCTQFVSGNVLDITCGKYLDFVKSNLLLKNGAKEVFSLDLLNDDQFIISRRLEKGKIICHMKNKKELDSIHFDTIIAFDVLSTVENFDNILKFISNNLKSNGTSIISIVSDDGLNNNAHDLFTKDLTLLSKIDFEKNLKIFFKDIVFFSQGTVTHNKISDNSIISKLKIKLRNFFLQSIKRYNFYLKYVDPIKHFFIKFNQNLENKKLERYVITEYIKTKQPLFLIAICKN